VSGEDDLFAFDRIEARLEAFDWPFVRTHATEIEHVWAKEIALRPATFDGRVLLQHHGEVRDGVFHAGYFTTSYKPFLSWTRLGWPGERGRPAHVRNGFSMAALRSRDGAFLLGKMGEHTANAGEIYFAAGTPDMEDVTPEGVVDLAGGVMRELMEETGLRPDEISIGEGWMAVTERARIAFMRPVAIDLPAEEARALILSRIAKQSEPELADIVIIRAPRDIIEDVRIMPRFMQRYLAHMLAHD
jgi:8-oxo-dGTP pyrophosphatase MutT (NUDIX family)